MNTFLPLLHRYSKSTVKKELEDFLTVSLGALIAADPAFCRALLSLAADRLRGARWTAQRTLLDAWLVGGAAPEIRPQEPAYSPAGVFQGRTDVLLRLPAAGAAPLVVVIEAKVGAGGVAREQLDRYEMAYPNALFITLVGHAGTAPDSYPCLMWREVAELAHAHRDGPCRVLAAGLAEVLADEGEADPWLGHAGEDWGAVSSLLAEAKGLRVAFRHALASLYAAPLRSRVFEAVDMDNDDVWPTEGFGLGVATPYRGERLKGATIAAVPDWEGIGLSWILEVQVGLQWIGGQVLRPPWRKLRGEEPAWYAADLGDCSQGGPDLQTQLQEATQRARSLLAGIRGAELNDEVPTFEPLGGIGVPAISRALRARNRIQRALEEECAGAVQEATGRPAKRKAGYWGSYLVPERVQVGATLKFDDGVATAWVWTSTKAQGVGVLPAMRALAEKRAGVRVSFADDAVTAEVSLVDGHMGTGMLRLLLVELLRAGIAALPPFNS